MSQIADGPLNQLRKAVIAQKTVNLEESPDRAELTELHNRLRVYDSFVSQLVITVLQGGVQETNAPGREDVEQELDRLREHPDPMVARDVRKYAQYKQRLDTMLALAQQVVEERKGEGSDE